MAIVYCIVCNITGEKYYGSTKQTLSRRLSEHKRLRCTSKQIISRGNFDIYKLIQCETREEALLKEDWYIRNKECVNKKRVCVTDEDRKEWNKEYNEKNIEKRKEWRKKNIEKIKEYHKEWYKKNNNKLNKK